MARSWVVLGVILAGFVGVFGEKSHPLSGYIITIPPVVVKESTTEVCASFHGISEHVQVEMTIGDNNSRQYKDTYSFPNGIGRCVNFSIPGYLRRGREMFHIYVNSSNDVINGAEDMINVTVLQRNRMVFIQTDKPIYKEGQIVRIRVYIVDLEAAPVEDKIKLIWVENSEGLRIKEWKETFPSTGLVEVEVELSEKTTLGEWSVHVSLDNYPDFSGTFMVEEYVLPEFSVNVEVPKLFNTTESHLKVDVCASYTYNRPVKGMLRLQIFNKDFRNTTSIEQVEPIISCKQLVIPTYQLPGVTPGGSGHFYITAHVTNNATKETLKSDEHKVSFGGHGVKLDLSSSPVYFKPNITYIGKIKATLADGEPAVGLNLRTYAVVGNEVHNPSKRNVVTDDKGEAIFEAPVSNKIGLFNLKAVVDNGGQHLTGEAEVKYEVKRWFSPNHQYLSINPVKTFPACTRDLSFNVTYFHESPDTKYIDLHYKLLSRGHVILSNHQQFALPRLEYLPKPVPTTLPPPETVMFPGDIRLDNRMYMESWKRITIIPNPQLQISRAGRITQWAFYAKIRGTVYLQIWRPSPQHPPDENIYILVGEKKISISIGQKKGIYHSVTLSEPIQVLPGDVFGMYFPKKNILPYDSVVCPDAERALYFGTRDIDLIPNSIHKFYTIEQPSWIPCREYPMQVTIEVDHQLELDLQDKLIPGHIQLNLTTPEPIGPSSELLIYYVTEEETVADSITVDAEACLRHEVSMQFVSRISDPGVPVTLQLNAAPNSLCALGAVDSSVYLLQAAKALTPATIYEKMLKKMEHKPPKTRKRHRRQIFSSLVDTVEAFERSGLKVISNLNLQTKPEMPKFASVVSSNPDPSPPYSEEHEEEDSDDKSRIGAVFPSEEPDERIMEAFIEITEPTIGHDRFYFPETWLWETLPIGPEGQIQIDRNLPHTLTEWKGGSVCLNSAKGMGISETDSVKTALPFFLNFNLPYSVVNEEKIQVVVTVYSYYNESICVLASMGMEMHDDFMKIEGNDINDKLYICGGQTRTFEYILKPVKHGNKSITFWVEYNLGRKDKDRVTKSVLVKPEGLEEEKTLSYFHCLPGRGAQVSQYMNLQLPSDVVPGSEYAKITAIADVLGPTLANLDKLLKMPTGCGEQNLATFAPSIQVLNYLANTDQLHDRLKRRAIKIIEKGYQTQLRFRNADGSFSAFRKDDPSVWLTAFVVRTFAQAQMYTYINDADLTLSKDWLLKYNVGDSGCFFRNGTGMVHDSEILGGLQEYTSTSLTAYVMAALLEARVQRHHYRITRAAYCLRLRQRFNIDNIYSQALIAYAFSLFDKRDQIIRDALAALEAKAIVTDMEKYWHVNTSGSEHQRVNPIDVEVTSYILMAMLARQEEEDTLLEAAKIVRWLTKQRNPRGGFFSTQDTVVAIQALTMYARRTYHQNVDLTVSFPGDASSIRVTADNRLVVQSQEVTPGELRVGLSGSGCVVLQASLTYNTKVAPPVDPHFGLRVAIQNITNLAHEYDPLCPKYHCEIRTMRVCTEYTAPGNKLHSDIAIVEINMVSGWEPHHHYSNQIKSHSELIDNVERPPDNPDVINVYFNRIMRQEVCFEVKLTQGLRVLDTKKSHVTVYSYYGSKDTSYTHMYKMEEICTQQERDDESGCLPWGRIH